MRNLRDKSFTFFFIFFCLVLFPACAEKGRVVMELDAPVEQSSQGQSDQEQARWEPCSPEPCSPEPCSPEPCSPEQSSPDQTGQGQIAQHQDVQDRTGQDTSDRQTACIYVHICGAVQRPGVYELREGSRVYEAVEEAGGFTAEACKDYVNQAAILSDGCKLIIPTEEEAGELETEQLRESLLQGKSEGLFQTGAPEGAVSGEEDGSRQGKININSAAREELMELPGVGESKAAAIIDYREKNGGFARIEDIMKVEGIKSGMYEKLKDRIKVE